MTPTVLLQLSSIIYHSPAAAPFILSSSIPAFQIICPSSHLCSATVFVPLFYSHDIDSKVVVLLTAAALLNISRSISVAACRGCARDYGRRVCPGNGKGVAVVSLLCSDVLQPLLSSRLVNRRMAKHTRHLQIDMDISPQMGTDTRSHTRHNHICVCLGCHSASVFHWSLKSVNEHSQHCVLQLKTISNAPLSLSYDQQPNHCLGSHDTMGQQSVQDTHIFV